MSGLRYCLDDRWLAPGEAALTPASGVIASGAGWFETLRVESGRPMFESAHLERLEKSIARAYGAERGTAEAEFAGHAARRCIGTMSSAFRQYTSGRLRLLLSRDENRGSSDAGAWQALGEWSEHRSSETSLTQGIDVVIASFAHPGLGFLGKSASYHWSLAAREEALARGASEALLLRDGQVIEGATGAIAWRESGRWFVHESPAALQSVTVQALRRAGVVLESGSLPSEKLDPACKVPIEGLILVSALRLAVAIRRCEHHALPEATQTAAQWRQTLLELHAKDGL